MNTAILCRLFAHPRSRAAGYSIKINYWDHRANELKEQELAGKFNARINSAKARLRADDLESRLQRRMVELEKERQLSALPPVIVGGALIVPIGLIGRLSGESSTEPD